MIHRPPTHGEASSSSSAIRYRDWESGLVLPSLEDHEQERICGLPDIGGHLMKIPLVVFQVLLCMRLEVHAIQIIYYVGNMVEINGSYLLLDAGQMKNCQGKTSPFFRKNILLEFWKTLATYSTESEQIFGIQLGRLVKSNTPSLASLARKLI